MKVTHDGTKGEVTITLPLGTYTISEVQALTVCPNRPPLDTGVLTGTTSITTSGWHKKHHRPHAGGDVVYDYSIINVGNANAEQIEKGSCL